VFSNSGPPQKMKGPVGTEPFVVLRAKEGTWRAVFILFRWLSAYTPSTWTTFIDAAAIETWTRRACPSHTGRHARTMHHLGVMVVFMRSSVCWGKSQRTHKSEHCRGSNDFGLHDRFLQIERRKRMREPIVQRQAGVVRPTK